MNKKLLLILSFAMFLICIASVNAYEPNDDLQSDDGVYYINYDDHSFNDIKTVLEDGDRDKVIYINSGVYTGLNNTNLTIDSNVRLIGHNVNDTIIDAENLNNIFTINKGANVFLANLTFVGGYELYHGGAINNYGKLSIDNCLFRDNFVFNDQFSTVYGAAIYNEGTLTLNNSSFMENFLGSHSQKFSLGGAVYTKGSLLVNNSYFRDNVAKTFIYTRYLVEVPHLMELNVANIPQRGGAIAGESNNVVILNSVFDNNVLSSFYDAKFHYLEFRRVSSGGAIDIAGNNLIVENCIFNNNSADVGGAVSFAGNDVVFLNNTFVGNSAYSGGALYTFFNWTSYEYYMGIEKEHFHTVKINNCLFKENYLKPRNAYLADSSIYNDPSLYGVKYAFNYAGCAVYLEMNDISISNSTFLSNTMDIDYDFDNTYYRIDTARKYENFCYGGAVYTKCENSNIDGCYFVNNSGDVGGALYSTGSNAIISNSYFAFNNAISRDGGAIYHVDGEFIVLNSTFINNNASIGGGAISSMSTIINHDDLMDNPHSKYVNCNFINNVASYGGAIYDTSDKAEYNNLTFIFNSAFSGGAIYNNGFGDDILDCEFVGNIAFGADYSNGGAIYNLGSNTKIYSSDFQNNSADYLGGSIYHMGLNIRCNDCEFNNSYAFHGGAVYLNGNNGRVDYSTFNDNSAVYGGAVYNNAINFRITNNNFKRNHANISGGAIYNGASILSIYSNQMENCSAGLYGNYIYTKENISYLTVSVLNNGSINIFNHENKYLFVNVTDNFGNPVTGGNVSFLLYNENSDEYIDLGVCSLYEGIAFVEFGDSLDFGSYKLYADYNYASEPILKEIGTVFSLISSELHVTVNTDLNFIRFNDTFNLEIVLIDGEGNYIENAEIQIYENYRRIDSVFTDNKGFYNYTSRNLYYFGNYTFTLLYDGDLIHDSASVEFNLTIPKDIDIKYEKTNIFSYYPLVLTSSGSEIPFEFQLKQGNADLGYFGLGCFYVLRNNELLENNSIFSYSDDGQKSYEQLSKSGTFFMPIVEYDPGVYVYTVCFDGSYRLWGDYWGNRYFAPTNTSVILIIKDDDANLGTKFTIDYASFNEVQFPSFNVTLKDSNGTALEGMNVSVYDSGNFITSFITTEDIYNCTLPYYLDKGEHLIEFVFGGFGNYSASYDAFDLVITENPNKKDTFFDLTSPRQVSGEGNNFTISLIDDEDVLLEGFLVDVEMFYNNLSVKNYTIDISDLNIPLNYGSGVYTFNCSFGGDRYHRNSSAEYIINVDKLQTELYGVSSVEVLNNNTFLNYVLVDENYFPLENRKIRMDIYSNTLNSTYYAFTNSEGLCNWKINLPVGKYIVLAYFEGEKWWEASPKVLTNVSIWGDTSKLISISSIVKNKGFYTVKLTDSEGKPLKSKNIIFTINGISYKRVSDENGLASLKINLNYGEYQITATFMGDLNYKESSVLSNLYVVNDNYKIPTTLSLDNSLTFRVNNQEFSIQLLDSLKNPLINKTISLLFNNKNYERTSDENGIVRYNLNLTFGDYDFKAYFDGDEDYESSNCSRTLKIVDKNANSTVLHAPSYLVFKERGDYFNVTLTDKKGNPLANQTVIFEVNGYSYKRITDSNGSARLKINFYPGSYEIYCHFDGTFSYFFSESTTKLVMIASANLNLSLLTGLNKFSITGKGRYTINLTDQYNNPLANKSVNLTINGITYTRVSDKNGIIGLNINLREGEYYISTVFNGDDDYRPSNVFNSVLTVKPTITRYYSSNIITKYYKSPEQFWAYVLDTDGNRLANASISMNINGVFYTRHSDENGTFRLNINLNPGEYILTAYDSLGLSYSFKIIVLPTVIVNNLIKVYRNDSQYEIKVLDASGKASANSSVSININGVFYNRVTDENGTAILNINLNPGKYIATVMDLNNGLQMSSEVLVLSAPPVFKSDSGAFIKKGESYTVSLKCSDGTAIAGEKVGIEINGIIYNRTVDGDGLASLRINLNKGTYLLKCHWYFNNQTILTNVRVT